MKLPAPAGNAPAEPAMPPMAPEAAPTDDLDFGGETQPEQTPETPEAPANDKPFDEEPFDAGIDVDEESDPKKFIEKLSGKIGQSLRDYTKNQGQPDFELEKFAINSLISATHTSEMDEEDKNDIIKKINKAGENDSDNSEDSDMGGDNNDANSGDDNGDGGGLDFGGDSEDGMDENTLFEEGNIFLENPPKCSLFAPEDSPEFMEQNRITEGDEEITTENLTVKEKKTILDKKMLKSKLQETFNQENMSEPLVEPIVKPITKPAEPAPSRRNRPYTIEPDTIPQVDPKAIK